jgi:hypothetical protein
MPRLAQAHRPGQARIADRYPRGPLSVPAVFTDLAPGDLGKLKEGARRPCRLDGP